MYHNGINLPTINTSQFSSLPSFLKRFLVLVMESATKIMIRHDKKCFRCPKRNLVFLRRLNKEIGFPHSTSRIEYVDAVLSRNTMLPGHIDRKNDHRDGYSRTAVYSYKTVIANKDYRVAIIMCTRSSAGACIKDIS